MDTDTARWLVPLLVAAVLVVTAVKAVRVVPVLSAAVVERAGRFQRVLDPGLHVVLPFVDRVRATVDRREQELRLVHEPVITADNWVVHVDGASYVEVTDPQAATYAVADYREALERLTVTTLRERIGAMDLQRVLSDRHHLAAQVREVLDQAGAAVGHPGQPGRDHGDRAAA